MSAEEAKRQMRSLERSLMVSPQAQAYIDDIRERSYVRHVLARHIETNDYARVRELRQKHNL